MASPHAAWDGNTADAAQIYLDGQLAATLPSSSNGGTNIADLFGIDLARTGFQGYEMTFMHNTALSATQVSQLYALHGAAGYALPSGTTVNARRGQRCARLSDLDGTSQQVVSLSTDGYTNGVVTNSSTNVVTLTLSAAGRLDDLRRLDPDRQQPGQPGAERQRHAGVPTGSNTYSGATTVSSGTLQLGDGTAGHDASLATNTITNNSALCTTWPAARPPVTPSTAAARWPRPAVAR